MLSRLQRRKRTDKPGEERSCPDPCGERGLRVGTRALTVKRRVRGIVRGQMRQGRSQSKKS